MAQINLWDYLQRPPMQTHVFRGTDNLGNTTNIAYPWELIQQPGLWVDFNIQVIVNRYLHFLQSVTVQDDAAPASPPRPVKSEPLLATVVAECVSDKVRRALRAGFRHPQIAIPHPLQRNLQGLTPLTFGHGDLARSIQRFHPDLAFCVSHALFVPGGAPNRVPGDIKLSLKWRSTMLTEVHGVAAEYFKLLAQVNFYMCQHQARYGFVLTDRELVAVKRLDRFGHLLLSEAIIWNAAGQPGNPPVLTVKLALWYLGILAADDQTWRLP